MSESEEEAAAMHALHLSRTESAMNQPPSDHEPPHA